MVTNKLLKSNSSDNRLGGEKLETLQSMVSVRDVISLVHKFRQHDNI